MKLLFAEDEYYTRMGLYSSVDWKSLGVELALNGILVEQKDMSWTAGFNVAYNQNKVTKLTVSDENRF